jgi:hypothetical protein
MSNYVKRTKQFRIAVREMPVEPVEPAKQPDIRKVIRAREAAEKAVRARADAEAREAARIRAYEAAWQRDAPARALREAEWAREHDAAKRREAAENEATRQEVWERLDRGWPVCDYKDWQGHAWAWAEAQDYKGWTPRCTCACCTMACNSMTCRRGCYS